MPSTKDMVLSSPDPLGMSNGSIPSNSPRKAGHPPLVTPRGALTKVSGNVQVQEFYINTPPSHSHNASSKKSPRKTTQSTSPWRIRLTVQAEEVDETQRTKIFPAKRVTEQTTTITVPLKGCDDTPPTMEKKGRGRPRKSLDSPVKRAATPKPKVGGRRKSMPESPKKQELDAHSETATPPKKARGRPRKGKESKNVELSLDSSRKNDLDVWLGSSLVGGEETAEIKSKSTRTRSRGRRQEITPVKIALDSDVDSQSSSAETIGDLPKELAWTLRDRHDETDQIDHKSPQSYEAPVPRMEQSLFTPIAQEQSILEQQDEDTWRSMDHGKARSPSPHVDDAQSQIDFDPTSQHPEYDSILESEGFSMVSVSSLPSVSDTSVSPVQQSGSLHKHTPTIASSPSVPPAPETAKIQLSPRHLDVPSDGTPKLAKVVRAGIALHGALSPRNRSQKLGSPFQESRKQSPFLTVEDPAHQRELSRRMPNDRSLEERLDDPFRGFGPGTRRELKAGLRLGEELAKRQRQPSQNPGVVSREGNDMFPQTSDPVYPQLPTSNAKEEYSLNLSETMKQVRYPLLSNNQLPSPERSLVDEEEDRMSWKVDTPIKQEEPTPASAQLLVSDESIGPDASAIDHTMIARKEEWQREREAVSKQIEMANKSQVIVIDTDDEEDVSEEERQDPEEDVADSDIWQSEAQSADQSRETTPEASEFLLQPEILKPRRSKIPSPWRSNSQVTYSDEVEPTESDLFWQPDQSQTRASKRRNARKRQPQAQSDISADSVFDSSLQNTRKAEAQIQLEASKARPLEGLFLGDNENSNTATSTEITLDDRSVQHADQTTKSPTVETASENHVGPEMTPTPEKVLVTDVVEVSKKIVTEGTSVKPTSATSKVSKAAIDPRLLQRKTRSSSASKQPIRPIRPLQSLQPTQSSTSWLSRFTAPIWSVFVPAASPPPAATKEDILCSSPHEPLCQFTPWEDCHFRALGPLYYGSFLYGAHLFPFNPRSPSARYCGAYVTTKLGWSRKIAPEDCGITDAFMVLLDERGFALGEPGAQWIDEGMVITMCVALWVGMIKRGEIEADKSKGEIIGLRDQGDRKWTTADIDWANNESAYFERKRREFDGLPSWKNKA